MTYAQLAEASRLTTLQCDINHTKYVTKEVLLTSKSSRQLLLTSIDIGNLFEGFPIYYSTLLDFRLRMYPLQYLMSRTTGYLKTLLEDYTPTTLTKTGIYNLLSAYYSYDNKKYEKFNNQLPNINSKKDLKYYFTNNKLKHLNLPLYFRNLELEITSVLAGQKKTGISLEIDQVASGPTIVALVTGNKMLAEKCNLLDKPSVCLYTFLLSKTKEFIKSNYDTKYVNLNSYLLLTEERKSQKYAIMCYFYNEQHLSRTDRWQKQYIDKFGHSPEDDDYELLSKFSIEYTTFLESAFPKLTKQLELINTLVTKSASEENPIRINTLDGCKIEWDFDYVQERKKNYYNPVSRKHAQVKVRIQTKEMYTQKNRKSRVRIERHKRSFMPNFIHSVDALIMRFFINEYYKSTKKRLNHLHDCVCIHPNDVDTFYKIASEIYCKPEMKTLAEDLIFENIIHNSVKPQTSELIELKNEFISNKDKSNFTLKGFFFLFLKLILREEDEKRNNRP